jgi:DNA-binding MarR family transcriptional regulator
MPVKPAGPDAGSPLGEPASDPPVAAASLSEGLNDLLGRVPSVVSLLRRMEPPPGRFGPVFDEHALGPRHSRVVMVVCFRGELSVTAVAEELDVSLPAASLLVGELDRAGILTRVEDARDRRRTLVRIHPIYEEAAEAWLEQRVRPWRDTLTRLSPGARAGFVEGWRILHAELSEHS